MAQVRKRSNTPAVCPQHEDNNVTFICRQAGCDGAFACGTCIKTDHKGHEMEKIANYAASKKQILKNKIKTGKDDILTFLLQNIKSTEQEIIENKYRIRDSQDKIIQRCNELKAELDKICHKYTELHNKMGDENDRKLTKHKECLETLYTQYKAELDECEIAVENGSDTEVILADRKFPTSPKLPNLPITDDLKFRFRFISNKQLEEWFGELLSVKNTGITMTTATTQSATALPLQSIQQMPHFVVKRDSSYSCFYIYSSSDQLFVWFFASRNISLINKDGNVTNTVTLQPGLDERYQIQDVSVSPVDGTLWSVSRDANAVQQVKQDGTPIRSFVQKFARSVCVTRSQSVLVGVGVKDDVNIFTFGKLRPAIGKLRPTKTLTKHDTGLSGCPYQIVQCQKTGRVAITDYIAVSVMDEMFRHLYTLHGQTVTTPDNELISTGYKPEEKFYPYSICFDRNGDLLVCDNNNYSVLLFSSSGRYIRTIVQETDKNKRPVAINAAPFGTLWIAYQNDEFKQIKYK